MNSNKRLTMATGGYICLSSCKKYKNPRRELQSMLHRHQAKYSRFQNDLGCQHRNERNLSPKSPFGDFMFSQRSFYLSSFALDSTSQSGCVLLNAPPLILPTRGLLKITGQRLAWDLSGPQHLPTCFICKPRMGKGALFPGSPRFGLAKKKKGSSLMRRASKLTSINLGCCAYVFWISVNPPLYD